MLRGPRMLTHGGSHDENHRLGKPGVQTMEKEFPTAYRKLLEGWNEYTQYTGGKPRAP